MNKLEQELIEYMRITPMNEEEALALKEWVADGNSVHTNPSLAEDGHGRYIDFLQDYRYFAGIHHNLEQLSEKEQEIYIARLRGEDTIDTLREDLEMVTYERNVYYSVLQKHGLLKEAKSLLERERKHMEFEIDVKDLPFK